MPNIISILRMASDWSTRSGLDCRDDQDANAKAKIIAKHIEAEIPTAPVQRHVEILNEDRDKVAEVSVRTDSNGKAN
jgi:hypothetical protein